MDVDDSNNNFNINDPNQKRNSVNNNNLQLNIPSQNDYQFSGLISGMNRYKTIPLGDSEKINNRSIVEITGEAGTGKSKLCYYLALKTVLPERYGGLEKSCLFVTTFKKLNEEKMFEFFEVPAKTFRWTSKREI